MQEGVFGMKKALLINAARLIGKNGFSGIVG